MKNTVIVTAEELRDAALYVLSQKPQFFGKHVATVEFVFDKSDPVASRQIRAEVVMFDTLGAAKRYSESGDETGDAEHDAAVAAGEPPASAEPAAAVDANTGLEGEKKDG